MILIIDGNGVAHRAKHTTGGMSFSGVPTGVIYGFFMQLHSMVVRYMPKQICFAWDSQSSHRKKIFPEYKMKRALAKKEKTPQEKKFDQDCFEQFYEIQEEILPTIGFENNFKIKGFEGDDLIASICIHNKGKKVIATSDNDMFQLISDDVSIHDLRAKKNFDEESFRSLYGIEPILWKDVKAIAGCDSDEVPGIKGVGKETAIKYIKGVLPDKHKVFQRIESEEGKQLIKRNRQLVELPFSGTPKIVLKKDKINFNKMKSLFMDYGFYSLMGKDKFKELESLNRED